MEDGGDDGGSLMQVYCYVNLRVRVPLEAHASIVCPDVEHN